MQRKKLQLGVAGIPILVLLAAFVWLGVKQLSTVCYRRERPFLTRQQKQQKAEHLYKAA